MENIKHIWTTVNIYVDIDTAEQLTKYQVQTGNYRIIKSTKIVKNGNSGKYIENTNECRKNGFIQLRINFPQ